MYLTGLRSYVFYFVNDYILNFRCQVARVVADIFIFGTPSVLFVGIKLLLYYGYVSFVTPMF